jgi:hypothetical protein
VQGILLNESDPNAGRSLEPFCDKIYRQSDFGLGADSAFDEIAGSVIGGKL